MPLTQSDYRAKLAANSPIQSSDVAKLPKPGTGSVPSSLKIKGNWVTYLAPADPTSLTRRLYGTYLKTNALQCPIEVFQPKGQGEEGDFSLEEKLRRERARMMSTGVTSYAWAGKCHKMLIPLGGSLWILDDPLGPGTSGTNPEEPFKLVEGGSKGLPEGAPILDAKICSDGSTVAFVVDNEVYVMSTAKDASDPVQVTSGARGQDGKSNGVADFVAQEELDRADGFWLSPKGTLLVYESVDESHIPLYRITHQGTENGLSPSLKQGMTCEEIAQNAKVAFEEHRYPFAGAENPKVKLAVVSTFATNNTPIWFDLEGVFGLDFYLAKVEWLSPSKESPDQDSIQVIVQLLDRRQLNLALLLLDCTSGSVTLLHKETAMEGAWINLNNSFRPLQNDNKETFSFLWASERDGYRHLYVLEASIIDATANEKGAKVVKRLTGPGEFIVEQILEVDQTNQCIHYMGTEPGKWLERHLFRVSMEGGAAPVCLTAAIPGQHSVVLNSKAGYLIDTVSSVDKAPVLTVYCMPDPKAQCLLKDTIQRFVLHDASTTDERIAKLGKALSPPSFHTFSSTDGKVTLQAAIYKPDPEKYRKGPWPLVVATYGGPHVQYVANTWGMMTADMRSQFLRANGYAVIKVDNRGSNRRGLVFEMPIQGNMGDLEVQDQVAGVQWAVKEGMADGNRVAVSGWSYGGYMSLKCLTDRPDVFHAAISGAPVTDWTLYDTAYTERYMGLPQENPEGYAKSSALAKIKDIEGSLLLCHGLLDENVLFRQSAVLVNELVAQQKAYDLVLFASERHGPRRPQDRAFMEERLLAFLQRSLGE